MAAIDLSPSQQAVVDMLRSVPGAGIVNVDFRVQILPNGKSLGRLQILGSVSTTPGVACPTCDHREWRSHFSASFTWDHGRFQQARVSGVNHRTLAGAMGCFRREAAKIAAAEAA